VSKNADANEIKKAYRKAAIKNHPDKGGDPEKVRENDNLIAPARDRDLTRRVVPSLIQPTKHVPDASAEPKSLPRSRL